MEQILKRGIFCVIFLLLIAPLTLSQEETTSFSEENAYKWLSDNLIKGEVNGVSLGVLALLNGEKDVKAGVDKLIANEDDAKCWPKGGCKIKETALATLALHHSGKNVDSEFKWLNESIISASMAGRWIVQIKFLDPSATGICTVNGRDYNVAEDKIDGKYSVDITDSVGSSVSKQIDVNCYNVNSGIILALIFKSNAGDWYILQSSDQQVTTLSVEKGCYPLSRGGACNYETTMFASWALKEMDKIILTRAYLESQIKENGLHYSVVGRVTGKPLYLDWLLAKQSSRGSWASGLASEVFTTAFSSFSLSTSTESTYPTAVEKGLEFLKRSNNLADGSWSNANVEDSAMALIALHGRDLTSGYVSSTGSVIGNYTSTSYELICDDLSDNDNDGVADCEDEDCLGDPACVECTADSDCEAEYGATYYCQSGKCTESTTPLGCESDYDCEVNEICKNGDCIVCNLDGKCDIEESCDCDDCVGSATCGTTTTPECTADSDCDSGQVCSSGKCKETESGFPWWIIILLLILIILGVGGYFFYVKYVITGKYKDLFKKKPKKEDISYAPSAPMQRPKFTVKPITPRRIPLKTKEDDELERSLKEAERIIRGS